MYQFISGPLVWLAFIVFFIGLIARIVWYVRGLDWQIDRVAYSAHLGAGIKGALRSIVHWLIPYGAKNWRLRPLFTIVLFAFHIGVIITPIFLEGHVVLLNQRLGLQWPTLPSFAADFLTVTVIIAALCIVIRRIGLPEVRILTTWYDYLLILLTVAPFCTGFLAVHRIGNYDFWLLMHILSGEVLLVAIPFTKLYHVVGFFLSRMQIGMDYGIKRGGMKGRGIAW